MAMVLYPVWLTYISFQWRQTQDSHYSWEYRYCGPSWSSWVLSPPYSILKWVHGEFHCCSCGFSLQSVSGIGIPWLYTCTFLRQYCGIYQIFTCNWIIFIVKSKVNQFRAELHKHYDLQRLGQYIIPNPLHREVLYFQVILWHYIRHEEIPGLEVFVPFGAGGFSIFSKRLALLLSCRSFLWSILYPCASMEYFPHNIFYIVSSTPMIQSSVEFFPFIFCVWRKWSPLL